jgi:molybdopterin-guanine dinucleotide biosynthesis adapter protein
MNSEEVTIISIAGKQNAGKTTLIRTLIPKLKEHGHRVGTLKYNIRKFEIDHEGKDSYKYFHSGADSVALSSKDKVAVIKRVTNTPEISEIIEKYLNDVDVVLVEGYREGDYPGIKIIDSKETKTAKKVTDNELLLIKKNLKTKRFSIKDTNKAIGFIENIIKRNQAIVVEKINETIFRQFDEIKEMVAKNSKKQAPAKTKASAKPVVKKPSVKKKKAKT